MPLRREGQAPQDQEDPAERQHRRHDQPQPHPQIAGVAHQDDRSQDQAHDTADSQRAEGRELDFEDEQPDAERNQQQAGHVDRQHLKGEEREQQADAAGDARERGPGFQSSTVSPSRPSVKSSRRPADSRAC